MGPSQVLLRSNIDRHTGDVIIPRTPVHPAANAPAFARSKSEAARMAAAEDGARRVSSDMHEKQPLYVLVCLATHVSVCSP